MRASTITASPHRRGHSKKKISRVYLKSPNLPRECRRGRPEPRKNLPNFVDSSRLVDPTLYRVSGLARTPVGKLFSVQHAPNAICKRQILRAKRISVRRACRQKTDKLPPCEGISAGFDVANSVWILTRNASETMHRRSKAYVRCGCRWRFGLVFFKCFPVQSLVNRTNRNLKIFRSGESELFQRRGKYG